MTKAQQTLFCFAVLLRGAVTIQCLQPALCMFHAWDAPAPGLLTSGASWMAREKSDTACSGRRCDRCTLPMLENALALLGSSLSTIWKKRSASSQRCSVAACTPATRHSCIDGGLGPLAELAEHLWKKGCASLIDLLRLLPALLRGCLHARDMTALS